jgi:hypothetical protein
MNYKEFKDYIENMVPYETIYEDGEGRMILVIKMLDAFTAMNRKWVGLTNEEIGGLTVFDGLHHVSTPLLAEFIKSIEAKLKEKNQ